MEHPAFGGAGTNETGDERYRGGDRNWIRKRVRDRGCIVSRKAETRDLRTNQKREISKSETEPETKENRIRN